MQMVMCMHGDMEERRETATIKLNTTQRSPTHNRMVDTRCALLLPVQCDLLPRPLKPIAVSYCYIQQVWS